MRILGIETSCDETAAAVVEDGRAVHSSVVSSQVDLHARYGGVVPEIASRAHVELIGDVIAEALVEAGAELPELDAVAACHGPGLAGALLVGVSAAKAIALATGLPYVGVNHLEAHLYAAWLADPDLEPPLAVLIVSGGHTMVVIMEGHGRYRVAAETVDDAAGEAFDKVARFLGLGYPGGPAIDRLAASGDPAAIRFPRAMPGVPAFSFAGLKTAVVNHVRRMPDMAMSDVLASGEPTSGEPTPGEPTPGKPTPGKAVADVAASFQEAVVDQLVDKLVAAADAAGAPTLVLGGGVAANSRLRARVEEIAAATGRRALLPPRELCTDNGAMIAAAAWWQLRAAGPTPLDDGTDPNLRLGEPATGLPDGGTG